MSESTAWLLPLGAGFSAAIGERELLHLVAAPALLAVPVTPYYCRQVLHWQQQLLPVVDLAAWLSDRPGSPNPRLLAVVGYQDDAGIQSAALYLDALPVRTQVDDSQDCPLPERPAGWHAISNACFAQGKQAVPILDLSRLFSGALLPASSAA